MIIPTKTVCYVEGKDGVPHEYVSSYECGTAGTVIETKTPGTDLGSIWFLDDVERIVVREEVIEQKPKYPWCNKSFNPLNACDCGNCGKALVLYPKVREAM